MSNDRKVEIFADGIIVRAKNRRVLVRKNKRVEGALAVEFFSVNKDKGGNNKGHVISNERLGRRVTAFNLSYDAVFDLRVAIELYHEHIEPVNVETWVYDQTINQ